MAGVALSQDMNDGGIDAVADPRLRQLVSYWAMRRGPDHPIPSRNDLQPAEIQPLLPWIMLLDVLDGDYRFRLVGTGLDGVFGRSLTGMMARKVWSAQYGQHWWRWMDRVSQDGCAVFTSALLHSERGRRRFDAVILPLSNQPGRIDMLLCGATAATLQCRTAPLLRRTDNLQSAEIISFDATVLTV